MKINEMTGDRVTNDSNRVVFLISLSSFHLFFFLYLQTFIICSITGIDALPSGVPVVKE